MLGANRFAKTIATSLCAALAAYAVATGRAEKDAHAQISGTIGGDLTGGQPIEDEGSFFEAGLFAPQAPGFMDYTDDACRVAEGGAASDPEPRACAFVSQASRSFMQQRPLAVAPRAVMAQTPGAIAIWEPR